MILLEFFEFGLAKIRHEGGEGLVQPEIVPPFHGDEVAEPHVAKLVQVCIAEASCLLKSLLLSSEKVNLVIGHASHVLHGTGIELCDKDLVIFVEWIAASKQISVELNASLGSKEHLLVLDVTHDGLPTIDPHWWHALNVALEVAVRSGDNNI